MAIYKRVRRKGAVYQVKLRDSEGLWITKSFKTEKEAKLFESKIVGAVLSGQTVSRAGRHMSVEEYWQMWLKDTDGEITYGWRQSQLQYYAQYIRPLIGGLKIVDVGPAQIKRIIQSAQSKGRAPSTCRHIFSILHKMFREAVEDYELIATNPVRRRFKPSLPEKESAHLEVAELKRLLEWVRGKPYELAILFGVYVGLRVGEIQALKWPCVDFENGVVHIRSTYARQEKVFRDYPKGRKWHSPALPPELIDMLRQAARTPSEYVCPSPEQPMLSYDGYLKALRRYCAEAGVRVVATHGLRHSTAGLYLSHGATRDDLRELFAHSSSKVTDRYIHGKSERLGQVANVIRLFPKEAKEDVPQNVPQAPFEAGR